MVRIFSPSSSSVTEFCRTRETARRAEQEKIVAEGKIAHDEELMKNPGRSIEGMACKLPMMFNHEWDSLISCSPHG
jgi:hypothetical protein